MNHCPLWILILSLFSNSFAFSAETYEPTQPPVMAERWRWHAQEALEAYFIVDCMEGEDGKLWFVSDTGMIRYDGKSVRHFPIPEGDSFQGYRCGSITPDGAIYLLFPGRIVEFAEGHYRTVHTFEGRYDMSDGQAAVLDSGGILFGTPDGIMEVREGIARIYCPTNVRASVLMLDSHGDLWTNRVGTGELLRCRNFISKEPTKPFTWETYSVYPDSGDHLQLAELPNGEIWCANDNPHHGIYVFNRKADRWEPSEVDASSEEKVHRRITAIPDGSVMIYGDRRILLLKGEQEVQLRSSEFDFPISWTFVRVLRSGKVVVGGRRDPIFLVDCSATTWETFHGLNYFCTDTSGRDWFISFEGNIVCRDPHSGKWTAYVDSDSIINTPLALLATRDGKVWAAGRHDDHAALSIFSDGRWQTRVHPELGMRISHQSMLETKSGAVLFGGGDDDAERTPGRGGILKYETNGDRFTVTHYGPPRVPYRIVGIKEDLEGNLWVGGDRLRRIDDFTSTDLEMLGDYTNSWIDSFVWSRDGLLWVAQWGLGIHLFDGEEWRHFKDEEEGHGLQVVSLLNDHQEESQVWALTSGGLINFSANQWVDSPLSSELAVLRESGSLAQSPDGTLWVNSSSRNWFFRDTGLLPGSERFESSFWTVAFKGMDIEPETTILESEARVLEPGLSYFQWTAKCQWSIASKESLLYSYRVDGGDWSPFSRRKEVVLNDLPNGQRFFEVRARTPFGTVDSQPARVEFTVVPVLWKRPWFILATLGIVAAFIGLITIIVQQRIRHLLALEEYRAQFFTNISHELRTPLMVILGPLEALQRSVEGPARKNLDIAYRNARKLVTLLDRLLNFRKAELGRIHAHCQVQDLVLFLRQEIEIVEPLAADKRHELHFHSEAERLVVAFDPNIFEVVVDNLLTNAIKYTPSGGRVEVRLLVRNQWSKSVGIRLEVTDTGLGIPRKELKKIFDPFHQVGGEAVHQAHSTGIGLAYTKSLVEGIGGRIFAESPIRPDKNGCPGSRFVVELDLDTKTPVPVMEKPSSEVEENPSSNGEDEEESNESKPLVLVVDDNDDIRNFLAAELSADYTVLTAANGEEGLETALTQIPDMILSDVRMPKLDGNEMTRRLKTDERTSHIPVILLTALKSEIHEQAGLETGADDYITKPVNLNLTRKRMENLLQNRRKMRDFFNSQTHSISIAKEEFPLKRIDQDFIAKLVEVIEANLINETFDVEDLAGRMFMSRMTLYRKVKAVTGHPPGTLIRSIRLKKAALYFETGSWTVSQVLEKVGFLDMSHFSRSFKKEFGCTPTEYIERFSTGDVGDMADLKKPLKL